jgi:hypothetical protein
MKIRRNAHNSWVRKVLDAMRTSGGVGEEKAKYIKEQGIAFIPKYKGANNAHWGSKWGWCGLKMDNTIHYPISWEKKPDNDPWVLSSFVHETVHLEQGVRTALSVYGELQAWQVGFQYYLSLSKTGVSRKVKELLNLPLSHEREILTQAKNLIIQDQNNGMKGYQVIASLIKRRKKFSDIYWIYPLPLNPWKK